MLAAPIAGLTVSLLLQVGTSPAEFPTQPLLALEVDAHTTQPMGMAFTPDGRRLVTVAVDKTVRIWEVATGDLLQTLRTPVGERNIGSLGAVAISPDGRLLAVGAVGVEVAPIYLIELAESRVQRVLRGHKGNVTGLSFSADGRWLASCSGDATVRVWDVATGAERHLLQGHTGVVEEVKFHPRDDRLASASSDKTLRIWSASDGAELRTIATDDDPLMSLAWDPQGRMIAVGTKTAAVRLYSAEGQLIDRIAAIEPGFGISLVEFTPDSRELLFLLGLGAERSTSRNYGSGLLNLDTRQVRIKQTDHDNTIYAGAVSPDGKVCASAGGNQAQLCLWRASDGKLLVRRSPQGRLRDSAAWSPDGTTIAWGGPGPGGVRIPLQLAFNLAALEPVAVPTAPSAAAVQAGDTVETVATVAARVKGEEVARFGANQSFRVEHLQEGWVYLRAVDQSVTKGGWVERSAVRPTILGAYRRGQSYSARNLLVRNGTNSVNVLRDGKVLSTLTIPDPVYSFTLLNDDEALVGARSGIHRFRLQTGVQIDRYTGNDNMVLSIAPSPDGKKFFAVGGYMPVQVWAIGREQPLASVYYDGRVWIVWTPEGYYAASPGAEGLMGWHVNAGSDALAQFYPSSRFRKELFQPAVISRLLETGSVERALAAAGVTTQVRIADILPPRVAFVAPASLNVATDAAALTVRAAAQSTGEHPVLGMKLLLNGAPYAGKLGERRFDEPRLGRVEAEWTVELQPGEHRLRVLADSSVSQASTADLLIVRSTPATAVAAAPAASAPAPAAVPAPMPAAAPAVAPATVAGAPPSKASPATDADTSLLPALYVLSVGVSQYEQERLRLYFAAKDATVLAEAIDRHCRPLFRHVVIKSLTDAQATQREVLTAFAWIKRSMTQHDVCVIFLSGHGVRDSDGTFYYLPVDADPEQLLATAVSESALKQVLQATPGRRILMLDACHAATFEGDRRKADQSVTDQLLRELATDDFGVITMCSSMGREFSLESSRHQHGYFTLAVTEGLSGKADLYGDDRVIHLRELDAYVSERVKELSGGKQHPITVFPSTVRSFPLARAAAR